MRRFLLAALWVTAMSGLQAATPAATDARARELIRTLKLSVLPKESGYLGIIGVSAQKVNVRGRMHAVQSQNYYMLTRERPIDYLHWLEPDDTHILVEGGPVDYFIFHPEGGVEKVTLGFDYAAGSGLWWQCRVVAGRHCGCTRGRASR
jgi:predicted cupin superfamily sugar epimerase